MKMKRFHALVLAVVLVVAAAFPLATLAAPTFVGETTVAIPGYSGLEITLSDAASKWGDHVESPYGTFNLIVVASGSTVTFSSDVTLNNMGSATGSVKAGEAKAISSMDGYYVYADDGALYTIFATTSAQSYSEASLNKDIADITVAAPEPEPEPEPEATPEPEPEAEPEPTPEPEPEPTQAPPPVVAEPAPEEPTQLPAPAPEPPAEPEEAAPPPAEEAPPAAAAPVPSGGYFDSIDIRLPQRPSLVITITRANAKYSFAEFIFNPAVKAYSLYVGSGGTVAFSSDTQLTFTDMTTYEQSARTFSAGTAYPISDISGGALYFSSDTATSDFATFMLDSDPTYAAGLEYATSNLANLWSGGTPAATGDSSMILYYIIALAISATGCVVFYRLSKRGKQED